MRIGRTIPPAAAPLCAADLWNGLLGLARPRQALETLEGEIRQQFGVRHVFLVSSATAALTLTLKAIAASSSRTGVVVPGYTCFSVPGAVVHAGLHPVPCDIDASTFDFDHTRLAQTIDDNTLCVVAHHLFGVPSDVARTRALCQPRGIFVIEDAAQGMGAISNGAPLGTMGDVGVFSFGRGKNVTAGGGGAIVTNSDALAQAIRVQCERATPPSLRQTLQDFLLVVAMAVFIRPSLFWMPAALPFLRLGETIFPERVTLRRMSGMQAGLLHHWQTRLRESNQVRSRTAAAIGRALGIAPPDHAYLRLPIMASSPSEKRAWLARSQRLGLGLSAGYPAALDEIPQMRAWSTGVQCPQARRVANHLVTAPVHHWLRPRDRQAICECLHTIATPATGAGELSPAS